MEIVQINYAGALLEAPAFLAEKNHRAGPLWPFDLPLAAWPTYCGAGDGLGDWLVSDTICGVRVCPACFIHDIEWAIARRSYRGFQDANNRLLRNLNALTAAHHLAGVKAAEARTRAGLYWAVVSGPFGWLNFEPTGQDPDTNPVVKAKLQRLARAKLGVT